MAPGHRRLVVANLELAPSPPVDRAGAALRSRLTLETLYRDHAKSVARWAIRLLGPESDYEDVVHDVFMVVKRRLPEFRGDAAITTWLYEITVRVVQNVRKRARWWSWLTGHGQSPGRGRCAPFAPVPEAARDPHVLLEARERTRLLYQLLDELPEEHRTVLILFELEGLPGSRIAEITGTNASTVWVRLSRARHKFLQRLRAWEARQAP